MKLEHFVAVQIALILLWAAVNIVREALRLQRARTELTLWRGKAAMPDSSRYQPAELDLERNYVQSAPAVPEPSSGSGHRPKGRGKKAKRRSR